MNYTLTYLGIMMKLAVKSQSFSQAIAHLRECGITEFTSCKRIGDEYIFKLVLDKGKGNE